MTNRNGPPVHASVEAHRGGRKPDERVNPDDTPPCDCPEAELVWLLLRAEVPPPDTAGFRALFDLAEAIALRKLRAVAPILEAAGMWAAITNPYVERRRITSVLDCGVCGQAVDVEHPLPEHLYNLLPDVSWVRCDTCPASREVA